MILFLASFHQVRYQKFVVGRILPGKGLSLRAPIFGVQISLSFDGH